MIRGVNLVKSTRLSPDLRGLGLKKSIEQKTFHKKSL